MAQTLIIAAVSARGYVQAAVACGYEVIVLDAFIDEETRAIAKQVFKLKFDDIALDEAYFKQVLSEMDLNSIDGFLYGSLFDNCPDVLDWVARQVRVIGNSAGVLKQAKDLSFFTLLDSLKIVHPTVQSNLPDKPEHWLSKRVGGYGGLHIRPAVLKITPDFEGFYFQQKAQGIPISMLFVADGNASKVIGCNQQLTAPMKNLPYRFAGAISNVILPAAIQKAFEYAAAKLTSALGLRGICSVDAILEDENLWVLELNPRLSATFHLYENLLPMHLQGCAGQLPSSSIKTTTSNAQLILYADEAFGIAKDFAWPDWAADRPTAASHESSVRISPNAPICSVLASAKSAALAYDLLIKRAKKLKKLLNLN